MSEIEDNADRRMSKNKHSASRRVYIALAIVGILIILYGVIIVILRMHGPPRVSNHLLCGSNLSSLGKALYVSTNDYDGKYPTADKWCDLLVMNYEVRLELLVCKGSDAKIGESSYALNKNIAGKKSSEIPSDIVLLFETKKGWNQVGGSELLNTENHEGKGCWILFNDMHAEFVKAERLGELKWDTEK